MKWNKTHRKGTKQNCIMHTDSGFWPSSSYLNKYFKYREECEAVNIEPATCEEYYYNCMGVHNYDKLVREAKQKTLK